MDWSVSQTLQIKSFNTELWLHLEAAPIFFHPFWSGLHPSSWISMDRWYKVCYGWTKPRLLWVWMHLIGQESSFPVMFDQRMHLDRSSCQWYQALGWKHQNHCSSLALLSSLYWWAIRSAFSSPGSGLQEAQDYPTLLWSPRCFHKNPTTEHPARTAAFGGQRFQQKEPECGL